METHGDHRGHVTEQAKPQARTRSVRRLPSPEMQGTRELPVAPGTSKEEKQGPQSHAHSSQLTVGSTRCQKTHVPGEPGSGNLSFRLGQGPPLRQAAKPEETWEGESGAGPHRAMLGCEVRSGGRTGRVNHPLCLFLSL